MSNPPRNTETQDCETTNADAPERLALTLDIQEYLGQLEDWDISESQKREFIVAFWNLLVTFGELGYGIHPAQTAAETGRKLAQKTAKIPAEKSPKTQENPTFCANNVLYSKPYYRTQIIEASEGETPSDDRKSPT